MYTLAELLALVGPGPKGRADRTALRRISLRAGQKRLMFLCQSSEPYSDPSGHVVSLIYPNIGPFERVVKRSWMTPMNRPCRVGCSCEAWRFYGSAYKSTEEDYRLRGREYAEDRPPELRDPAGENWVCKHVARVARELSETSFAELLSAVGSPKTAMHAQADLDALQSAVEDFCVRERSDDRLPWLSPETAEETLAELGMLCPHHLEDDDEDGEW